MNESKIERLEAIYRRIPKVHCQGLCGETCCGPLAMTKLEWVRIAKVAGELVKADPQTHRCNMLSDDGRCLVYSIRPLVCRIWGAVRALVCPHGCVPDRYLTVQESMAIVAEINAIGGKLVLDPIAKTVQGQFPESRRQLFEVIDNCRRLGL